MRIFFFHLQKKAECFVSMLMVPRGIEMLPSISCFRRQVLVTYNGISSIVLNRKGLGELVSCRLFPCGGCLQNTPCVSSSRTWFVPCYWPHNVILSKLFPISIGKNPEEHNLMFCIHCHYLGIGFSLMTWDLYHSNCLDHTIRIYCMYVAIIAGFSASPVCDMNSVGQMVFLFNENSHNSFIFPVVFLQWL